MVSRPTLLVGLALFPLFAAAQPWLTTEWSVECTEDTFLRLGDLAELNCVDTDITGAAAIGRGQLEDASPWMRDLGFPGPAIQITDDDRYRAWISDAITERLSAWGVYVPRLQELYLSSDYWIHVDPSGELGIFLNRPSDRTMVHELFHAVQRRYRDGSASGPEYRWIWEGTAEAVEYSWFTLSDPSAPALHPRTARGLDESLHAPTPCVRESCPGAYNRYYFWSMLGEILGARDRISYLPHIFEQDLRAANGLTGLHTGLTRWHRGGLYHYYPEFIARYADHKDYFNGPAYVRDVLPPPAMGTRTEKAYTSTILPVAAHAYELIVPVSGDVAAGATLTLEGNDEALHLIVDGERYDYTGGILERNVYRTVLYGDDGPDTLHVRVAHIGPEPAATEEDAYTLTLELDGGVAPCSEASFIAALNRRSPEMRDLVDQAAALRARVVAVDETESVFMLGRGDLSINGDGGVACVTPFGVSDLEWEADRDPSFDAEATMEELVERHIGRVSRESGVSEANIRRMLAGDRPAGVTPPQMMAVMESIRAIAAEPQSDDPGASGVYFHIFSPHLVPVVAGGISPDNLRSPDTALTLHSGVGGWAPNAAASVVVYMPGVQASDIHAEGLYPAVAFSLGPEDTGAPPDGPESKVAFYTRWHGDWERYRCGGSEREDFDGEQTTLYGRLEGTVTISEVTPTRIEGTFQLSGPGTQETFTGTVRRTYDLNCPREPETDEATSGTSVSISGRFTAPNMRAPLPFAIAGVGRAVPVGQ